MQPRLQKKFRRYDWDRAAEYYQKYWQKQLKPAQDKILQMANLRPGERVLDLACGTGLVTLQAAASVGRRGRTVGTDISEMMVQKAAHLAEQAGYTQASFLRMDAEKICFNDAAFDVAFCALGLMYLADPLQALREMHRVLRPGGRAVAAVWGQRSKCGWAEVFPIVDARIKTDVSPLFFQLGTGDGLALHFHMGGFEEIESTRIATRLFYPSAEAACAAVFQGGPVALAHANLDEPARSQVCKAYLKSIESFRGGDGYRIPGEFVIVKGRKARQIRPASN